MLESGACTAPLKLKKELINFSCSVSKMTSDERINAMKIEKNATKTATVCLELLLEKILILIGCFDYARVQALKVFIITKSQDTVIVR